MSRRRRLKNSDLFFSEHHLTPKSEGGKGKDKKRVLHNKHVAWHTLVKNSLPEEAAKKLSDWINPNYKFFAVSKGESIYKTAQKINEWLRNSDVKLRVVFIKQSKIIQFPSRQKRKYLLPKVVS